MVDSQMDRQTDKTVVYVYTLVYTLYKLNKCLSRCVKSKAVSANNAPCSSFMSSAPYRRGYRDHCPVALYRYTQPVDMHACRKIRESDYSL